MNEKESSDFLQHIVKCFSPGIRYTFAYGSGVFQQQGHESTKDNMLDFIFVVNDAFSWHYQTQSKYPDHYSFLSKFGPKTIANVQKHFGAKIYFNTLVEFDDRIIKYGVIDLQDFSNDMLNWETMYVAGRLHKPVLSLKGLDDPSIDSMFKRNLRSAVETSLLTLPESFPEEELYLRIAGLSYSGDIRMIVGEDKGKVKNIVSPNIHRFRDLYSEIISKSSALNLQNGIIEQNLQSEVQAVYLKRLPSTLKNFVCKQFGIDTKTVMSENIDTELKEIVNNRDDCQKAVSKGIHNIIRGSSSTQTVKGLATAGFNKSYVYGLQKLNKMVKSMKR